MRLRYLPAFAIAFSCMALRVEAGSPCDVNSDGVVNVLDVQLAINQALGLAACTTGDIDLDGTCTVVDVQGIVNAALGGTCPSAPATAFSYTTGFLGNSFSTPGLAVPSNVRTMAVNAAGVVATNTVWEEGGEEAGIIVGGIMKKTPTGHGWGLLNAYGQGAAINSKLAFFAESIENGNTSATGNNGYVVSHPEVKWPPFNAATSTNYQDFGVFILNTDGTSIGGGEGFHGTFYPLVRITQAINGVPTGNDASVKALSCTETNLYAYIQGQIKVFPIRSVTAFAQTGMVPSPTASWAVPGVTGLAANPNTGDIWAIQGGVVTGYSASGTSLGQQITDVSTPSAIAFNPAGAQLLVSDGTADTVRSYNLTPVLSLANVVGTSMLSGSNPGTAGNGRRRGIVGIGVDAANNLYTAENRGRLDAKVSAYTPAGSPLWSVQSIGSIDIAEPDPKSDSSWYSTFNRMNYDYTSGTWTEAAVTLNAVKYPHDPRTGLTRVFVRYINGRRFLFGTNMYTQYVFIYRINPATDGEIAIPCGAIVPKINNDTMVQPSSLKPLDSQYIWRDLNGNGDFDAGEFLSSAPIHGDAWNVQVDDNGNVTILYINGPIQRFPMQGLDANGSPIYSYSTSVIETAPAPFTVNSMGRAIYNGADDTMILSGYTASQPLNSGEPWGQVGKVVAMYDHWSTTKTLRYQITLPFDPTHAMVLPHAMAVAGDRIFLAQFTTATVLVYQKSTGNFVGTMTPAPAMWTGAWIDTPTGLQAFMRTNGQMVISEEEEVGAKNLLYFATGGP